MKLIVSIKNVYGIRKIYPECEIAEKFCRLLGTKTLTDKAIEDIKSLGYKIEVKQEIKEL
jgi:hypothetical protein